MDAMQICDNIGATIAIAWFKDQSRNPHNAYYLWYRKAEDGEKVAYPIHSEDNPDPERYRLACSERMPSSMPTRQMAAWISDKCRSLPILYPNM
jgi:hypothetical protein